MKVRLGTIEVDDEIRRALRHRQGRPGLATRAEVRNAYRNQAEIDIELIVDEYRQQSVGEKHGSA
jgi:hypothetical protein